MQQCVLEVSVRVLLTKMSSTVWKALVGITSKNEILSDYEGTMSRLNFDPVVIAVIFKSTLVIKFARSLRNDSEKIINCFRASEIINETLNVAGLRSL